MESIYEIKKGDHLCIDNKVLYHHLIVLENYATHPYLENDKELKIIEYTGPFAKALAKIAISEKNLHELGDVYKIIYTKDEAFDSGEL